MRSAALVLLLSVLCSPLSAAVRGFVYDEEGAPLANVKVTAGRAEPQERQLARLIMNGAAPAPLASATTDAEGQFQLDVANFAVVEIRATFDQYTPWLSLERADEQDLVITLGRARMRTGRITSPSGPVKGAIVAFTTDTTGVVATYRTDERGTYTAPDPTGWASGFAVLHQSFVPQWTATQTMAGAGSANLRVEAGRTVSGKVVDGDKPVAGATVYAGGWPLARTDEKGAFAISNAPAEVAITAVAGTKSGTAPPATDTTIRVAEGRTLAGSVRDSKRRGLAGVVISAGASEAEAAWASTVTDANGDYRIEALPADVYNAWIIAPESWKSEGVERDLRRERSARGDFVVAEQPMLRGIVLDESRKPVRGARVMLMPEQMPVVYARITQMGGTVSNGAGRFRLIANEEMPGMRVGALKAGYAAGVTQKLDDATRARDISITLRRGVELTGVVVDSEGKPQPGAAIVAVESSQMLNALPVAAGLASGTVMEWTRTDTNGKFAMRVNAAAHDISVWKEGFAATDKAGVAAVENMDPVRVVLPRAVEVRGRVIRKGGTPVTSGSIVVMSVDGNAAAQTSLDADGTFAVTSLSPGNYMLMLHSTAGTLQQTVTAPARDVVLELAELATIRGRVSNAATGAPITDFTVAAMNTEAMFSDSKTVSDPSGAFTIDVSPGATEIEVSAPGFVNASREVVAEAGGGAPVEFALVRGRRIHGRVTSESSQPTEEARVSLGEERYGEATVSVDEEGNYEISVPTSDVALTFSASGHLSTTRTIAAGADDAKIDVTLASGKKITGKVLDASGAGVSEAHVYAYTNTHGAESQSAETTSDGSFVLSGLLDAHYDISASKAGAGKASVEDVNVATTKNLTLRLSAKGTATIHGTVAGAASGGWMMGMVTASSESDVESAQIARDGSYRIEGAPSGDVSVRAMLMTTSIRKSTPAVKVQVADGANVEVNLSADAGLKISGRVTSDGQPFSSASVTFNNSDSGQWTSMTNADGQYEMSGLEPGTYSVRIGTFQKSEYETELEVRDSTTFDIAITRATLSGRVIDETGAPIAGATVTFARNENRKQWSAPTATTNAGGEFSMAVQGDSAYTVSASRKGYVNGSVTVDRGAMSAPIVITLGRGEGQTLRLVDARNGATLSGYVVVTDETGKTQIPVEAKAQADGTLHLPLPNGRYRISASAGDYASATVRTTVPSPELRLALTPGGTLVVNAPTDARHLVRLVMPNGEEYVRCYCNGIAEIRLEGSTTTVEHVAAGPYRMDLLDAAGSVVRSYPITITEGGRTVVDATK